MKPEQKFHNWIKDHVVGHHQRIESIAGNSGIPDLSICWQGKTAWVELKVPVNGRVLLRTDQYAWGIRRAVFRDRVFVVADFDEAIFIWRYTTAIFEVEPYSKYLWLKSTPTHQITKKQVSELNRILYEL